MKRQSFELLKEVPATKREQDTSPTLANAVKLNLSPDSDEVTKHEAETLGKQVISLLEGAKLSGKSLIIRTEGGRGINQATMIIEVKRSDLNDQFKGFLKNIMTSLKTSPDSIAEQKGSIEILRKGELKSKTEGIIEIPSIYSSQIILKVLSDEEFDKIYRPEEIISAIRGYYQKKWYIDNDLLTEKMAIEDGYVRLAIVKETKQTKKERTTLEEKKIVIDERNQSFENIYSTKNSIEIADLFKPKGSESVNGIIVLGRAGIGKSMICQYIAYHWSKSNGLFNDKFDLLIWLPLRNLLNLVPGQNNILTISDAIFHRCLDENSRDINNKPFEKARFKEGFNTIQEIKKILYVLDGYDEIAHVLQQKPLTPQGELIKQLLSEQNIILTSRPHYIQQNPFLHPTNQKPRKLENIGFLSGDIDNYVDKFFIHSTEIQEQKEKIQYANGLKAFLNTNPNAKGMAHVPINLSFLCDVWKTRHRDLENEAELTLTKLYSELLLNLSLKYLQNPKNSVGTITRRWTNIKNQSPMIEILAFFRTLAFQQMKKESLIISPEELFKAMPDDAPPDLFRKVVDFGLLKPLGELHRRDEDKSYYFIHLTFQEFLAAHYIADRLMLKPEQREQRKADEDIETFIKEHKYHPRYEIVWWFVAGLLKNTPNISWQFWQALHKEPIDAIGIYHITLLTRCLEESHFSGLNMTERDKLLLCISEYLKKSLQDNELDHILQQPLINALTLSPTIFREEKLWNILLESVTKGTSNQKLTIIKFLPNIIKATPVHALEIVKYLVKDSDDRVRLSLIYYRYKGEYKGEMTTLQDLAKVIPYESFDLLFSCFGSEELIVEAILALREMAKILPYKVLGLLKIELEAGENIGVRKAIARTLIVLAAALPKEVIELVPTLFDTMDYPTREAMEQALYVAIQALSHSFPKKALKKIEFLLNNQNPYIKIAAIHALPLIALDYPVQSVECLKPFIFGFYRTISTEAYYLVGIIIKNLQQKAFEVFKIYLKLDQPPYIRKIVGNALIDVAMILPTDAAIKELESLIQIAESEERQFFANALSKISKELPLDKQIALIKKLLECSYSEVRNAVVHVLGEIAPANLEEILLLLPLHDTDASVRISAVRVLIGIAKVLPERALSILQPLLSMKNLSKDMNKAMMEVFCEIAKKLPQEILTAIQSLLHVNEVEKIKVFCKIAKKLPQETLIVIQPLLHAKAIEKDIRLVEILNEIANKLPWDAFIELRAFLKP